MALIKSSPGQQWPGFSFALHPLRVQGFCFALLQYSPIQTFITRFASSMQLYRQRHKTAHKALQVFFLLFDPFNRSRYQTDTSGYNTACATPDAAQVSAAAYYNKVYRGGSVSTCTGSAQRLVIWHPTPGGAVQRKGRGGQRGTIDGYRRISFRAFAR